MLRKCAVSCWGVWCGRCGGPLGWWIGFLGLSCVFALAGVLVCGGCVEVSLVFWTGVFLSPGRKKICVTGKETGPRLGGYG